jgi:hypothetical protein
MELQYRGFRDAFSNTPHIGNAVDRMELLQGCLPVRSNPSNPCMPPFVAVKPALGDRTSAVSQIASGPVRRRTVGSDRGEAAAGERSGWA